jgi:hypothetical protein
VLSKEIYCGKIEDDISEGEISTFLNIFYIVSTLSIWNAFSPE